VQEVIGVRCWMLMMSLSCCRDRWWVVGVNGVSEAPPSQGGRIKTRVGYIAQTIKDFEKALHAIFPRPFLPSISSTLSAQSIPSIFPPGPNDLAKRPHLEAHSGRMTTSKRPFCKAIRAERSPIAGMKSPLQGVGGLLVDWKLKKGNTCVLPLLMQRYDFFCPFANV